LRSIIIFLVRGEFIFELGRTVVAEVPQLGNATYVFTRPADIQEFVRCYATTTREDIVGIAATLQPSSDSSGASCTGTILRNGSKSFVRESASLSITP
jgi:hypothetical protein